VINLDVLNKLGENYKLECKAAKGGVPKSIWESYSAFANTSGGTIILGIDEVKNNGSTNFVSAKLSYDDVLKLQTNFWNVVNDSSKISTNFLRNKDVSIEMILDGYVLVIDVDEASKYNKPVYINNNLYNGTFKRNHEGDYHCTKEEIQAMLRDSDINSRDSYIVKNMALDVLSKDTITVYRNLFLAINNQNHPFSKQNDENFLISIGAAQKDDENITRPTRAGLLMFGIEHIICKEYPSFFLDYQDLRHLVGNQRWSNRITSMSGDWTGNIFDFFMRIDTFITQDLPKPFQIRGLERIDVTPMHEAIREALCNTLSNCDFNIKSGVVIRQYSDKIVYINSGLLPISYEQALAGGKSMPRNEVILKIFNMVGIGDRAGTGIPKIMNATKEAGYITPTLVENQQLMDTTLTIFISKTSNLAVSSENLADSDKNLPIDNENLADLDKNLPIDNENLAVSNSKVGYDILKEIINKSLYRTDVKENLLKILNSYYNSVITSKAVQETIPCSERAARDNLNYLKELDIIEPITGQGKGKYKFK